MLKDWPACLLLQVVQHSFGCVDWRPATDSDNHVRARLLELAETVVDVRDGGMLAHAVVHSTERIALLKHCLHFLHHVGLMRNR